MGAPSCVDRTRSGPPDHDPGGGARCRRRAFPAVLAVGLAMAAQHGHIPVMERLLRAGADPNRRPPYDHHATAPHWAVVGDQPASAAWLLDHGADPALRDASFDSTPRGWAEHLGGPPVFDAPSP